MLALSGTETKRRETFVVGPKYVPQFNKIRESYFTLDNWGLVSPDNKFFFMIIPKNANSWIRNVLMSIGWKYLNLNNLDDSAANEIVPLMVWRDPVDRWIRGTAHVLAEIYRDQPTVKLDNDICKLIFSKVDFDLHNRRQIDFMIQARSRIVCFRFGSDLRKNLSGFLHEHGYKVSDAVINEVVNPAGGQEAVTEYVDQISKAMQQPEYSERVMSYITHDLQIEKYLDFYEND